MTSISKLGLEIVFLIGYNNLPWAARLGTEFALV